MKQQVNLLVTFAFVTSLATFVECLDRQASGRRVSQHASGSFNSPCGTLDQVTHRVGGCMDQIFGLVEGKFDEPKGDADYLSHCNKFNATEKCIRLVVKDCLTGLPKTTTSAVAAAVKRFRTGECKDAASRAKYKNAYSCARKRGPMMAAVYKNHTAIGQAIRDLPNTSPEDKMQKICCLFLQLDDEIERQYNSECPDDTHLLINLVHALTDDARSTLCRNPKCDGALSGLTRSKYKPGQNFVEPLVQVLYTLGTE